MIGQLILVVLLVIAPNFISYQVTTMDHEKHVSTVDYATEKISVKKCCKMNEIFSIKIKNCIASKKEFKPIVHKIINDKPVVIDGFNVTENFEFVSGFPVCPNGTIILKNMGNNVTLIKDGSSIVEYPNVPTKVYTSDEHCLENFLNKNNDTIFNAFICVEDTTTPPDIYRLNSVCMLISCLFIVITVAVYAYIPELRNLHGKVLIACLLCFLVGFTFLASLQILILNYQNTSEHCLSFTFIIYFSFLSAFFWLNVMCYDIWWTFSGRRSLVRDASDDRTRFVHYCLYAFGIPMCLTILLAALEFGLVGVEHNLLPNIERNGCFLYKDSKLLYFNLPILIVCVANIVFFALTAKKISDSKSHSEKVLTAGPHNRRTKSEEHRYCLYFKLFVVMGLSWVLEVVSHFKESAFIWKLTDTYNLLSGFFIFIIFVCKAKTLKLIRNRFIGVSSFSKTQSGTTSVSLRTYSDSKNEMTVTAMKVN